MTALTRAQQAAVLRDAKRSPAPPQAPKPAPAERAPAPAPEPVRLEPAQPAFDPADWPVADVLEYIDSNPADGGRVLELEAAGKGRKSILYRGQ